MKGGFRTWFKDASKDHTKKHFRPVTTLPEELNIANLHAVSKLWGKAGTVADMRKAAATSALVTYAPRGFDGAQFLWTGCLDCLVCVFLSIVVGMCSWL